MKSAKRRSGASTAFDRHNTGVQMGDRRSKLPKADTAQNLDHANLISGLLPLHCGADAFTMRGHWHRSVAGSELKAKVLAVVFKWNYRGPLTRGLASSWIPLHDAANGRILSTMVIRVSLWPESRK